MEEIPFMRELSEEPLTLRGVQKGRVAPIFHLTPRVNSEFNIQSLLAIVLNADEH